MRLIDADVLRKNVDVSDEEIVISVIENVKDPGKWYQAANAIAAARVGFLLDIDDEPTVDAVPVVRCKNCIHACKSAGNKFPLACCVHGFNVKPDDFCSYGEKTEEKNP